MTHTIYGYRVGHKDRLALPNNHDNPDAKKPFYELTWNRGCSFYQKMSTELYALAHQFLSDSICILKVYKYEINMVIAWLKQRSFFCQVVWIEVYKMGIYVFDHNLYNWNRSVIILLNLHSVLSTISKDQNVKLLLKPFKVFNTFSVYIFQ